MMSPSQDESTFLVFQVLLRRYLPSRLALHPSIFAGWQCRLAAQDSLVPREYFTFLDGVFLLFCKSILKTTFQLVSPSVCIAWYNVWDLFGEYYWVRF